METARTTARTILARWKGDRYAFGTDCLSSAAHLARSLGKRALIIANTSPWLAPALARIETELIHSGVEPSSEVHGSRPNAPREDLYRMQDSIQHADPSLIIAMGGGSTIDCAKAANMLAVLQEDAHDVEPYFGAGQVTAALRAANKRLTPLLAVQCASGSAAHLTKYSNITDPGRAQKKLIIDESIVPMAAVFDYGLTCSAPAELTSDGALDGIAHLIEVYYGATGDSLAALEPAVRAGVELIVSSLPQAIHDPNDIASREALGLGSDLGGYAIMHGGTNGAHLNSFSMVDVLSHGRACALMNPYYTVLFAPAIQPQLKVLAGIYARHGFQAKDAERLSGRDLGVAVAEAMFTLSEQIGFPTRLSEVEGFSSEHIHRALVAAKNPQLASKLQSMPIPIPTESLEELMGSVLRAAVTGNLDLIENRECEI